MNHSMLLRSVMSGRIKTHSGLAYSPLKTQIFNSKWLSKPQLRANETSFQRENKSLLSCKRIRIGLLWLCFDFSSKSLHVYKLQRVQTRTAYNYSQQLSVISVCSCGQVSHITMQRALNLHLRHGYEFERNIYPATVRFKVHVPYIQG